MSERFGIFLMGFALGVVCTVFWVVAMTLMIKKMKGL